MMTPSEVRASIEKELKHREANMTKKPNWFQRVVLRQRDWRIPPGVMIANDNYHFYVTEDYTLAETIIYAVEYLRKRHLLDREMIIDIRAEASGVISIIITRTVEPLYRPR